MERRSIPEDADRERGGSDSSGSRRRVVRGRTRDTGADGDGRTPACRLDGIHRTGDDVPQASDDVHAP